MRGNSASDCTGTSPIAPRGYAEPVDGTLTMALLLGALLLFSFWLPEPLLEVMRQAASIIGGAP